MFTALTLAQFSVNTRFVASVTDLTVPITKSSSSCNTSPGAKVVRADVVLTTTAVVLVAVSVLTCTVDLKSNAPLAIAATYKSPP